MESATWVPIVQAASKAGIVIGFVRVRTEPFAMTGIVIGNSRGVGVNLRGQRTLACVARIATEGIDVDAAVAA